VNPRHLGRLLRTIRHISPRQIVAQALHTISGDVDPVDWPGEAPPLACRRSAVPCLPAPDHARFDGWSRIELIGREVQFREGVDWDVAGEGPLWTYHLHQFDYLRDPGISPQARWSLMQDWIERCRGGAGWSPHPTSLRILSWGKLILTPGALDLDPGSSELLRRSLAIQAETLSRNLELRLRANHLFSNLLGVVFAGLLFEGPRADSWLRFESEFRRELGEQILADGSHVEGSPMYHGLLLENVLDLLNLARSVPRRTPPPLLAALEDVAARMLGAHRVWCHPDGEVALLGDSAFGIAQPPERLDDYAAALGVIAQGPVDTGVLPDAGIARLQCGSFTLIASASPPMPSYQPGHAHCDALSFELSVGEQRVVVDTGVTEYIPGPLRDQSRATRSHATFEVGGREQAEVWAAHRVGGRPGVSLTRIVPGVEIAAQCAGWATPDSNHRRVFRVDSGSLEIRDRLEGPERRVRMALPLAPGLVPELRPVSGSGPDSGGEAFLLRVGLERGFELEVELPRGVAWRIGSAPYFPRFGSNLERACLIGEADGFREGTWRFNLRRRRGTRRGSRRAG